MISFGCGELSPPNCRTCLAHQKKGKGSKPFPFQRTILEKRRLFPVPRNNDLVLASPVLRRNIARQFVIDNAGESLHRLRAGNQPAVDKKSGSTRYIYTISFLDIFLDVGLIFPAIKTVLEASDSSPTSLASALKISGLDFGGLAKSLS